MANPYKGDFEFKIGEGDDAKSYKLNFGMDALVTLEETTGLSIVEIVPLLQRKPLPSLKILRALMYAGLKTNHPEMTERLAGEVILQMSMEKAGSAVNEAFARAFPDQEGGEAGGGAPDPTPSPPTAVGIGQDSLNKD